MLNKLVRALSLNMYRKRFEPRMETCFQFYVQVSEAFDFEACTYTHGSTKKLLLIT